MDKIWYKNSSKSEVICRCGGEENEKTNDHAEPTKVECLKKKRSSVQFSPKDVKNRLYSIIHYI